MKKTNRELFNEADELTKYQIIVDFIRNYGESEAKEEFRSWLDKEVD